MGLPLQELQRKTSSTEFNEWIEYLNLQENEHDKHDFYLAQLACEVRRSYVDKPADVKLETFLIKFVSKNVEQDVPKPAKSVKDRIRESQAAWGAAIGLKIP